MGTKYIVNNLSGQTINGQPIDPKYKVFTALLTQSGGSEELSISTGEAVVKGVTYMIDGSDGDFSNVGAPSNESGTWFVAINNEVPNSYGSTRLLYNTGAPVVTVLENTIGNIWFTYGTQGLYYINNNVGWNTDKLWYGTSGIGNSGEINVNPGRVTISIDGPNPDLIITTYNNDYTSSVNDQLKNTPIEIRIYN